MHRTTDRFWKCFEKLPAHMQDLAEDNFELLKDDPRHPSLHFKKIGKLWSARVGLNYRALAFEDGEDFIWVWIGTHDEYMRIITLQRHLQIKINEFSRLRYQIFHINSMISNSYQLSDVVGIK